MSGRTRLFWKIATASGPPFGGLFSLILMVAGAIEPTLLVCVFVVGISGLVFGVAFGWVMSGILEPVSFAWRPDDPEALLREIRQGLAAIDYSLAWRGDDNEAWKPGPRAGVMAGRIYLEQEDGRIQLSGPKHYVERLAALLPTPPVDDHRPSGV